MKLLYPLGIRVFSGLLHIAALFNSKAAKKISGTRNWKIQLKKLPAKKTKRYWFHCASLGEFDMALPVIRGVQDAGYEVVISFFSSSGYTQKKDFRCLGVFYLPTDTAANASVWYNLLQPDVVVFVKYEFWLNYMLRGLKSGCKMFVISANFRQDQFLFKTWGTAWRKALQKFDRIFVQNEKAFKLLKIYKFENASVSGDSRFDKVLENIKNAELPEKIRTFSLGKNILILGSSWIEEEDMLAEYIDAKGFPADWRIILAPHDISASHTKGIRNIFPDNSVLYSEYSDTHAQKTILIIDNIGLLSSIYSVGKIAFIGGAFAGGLHNILEAAAFGMPILFGPEHDKFPEAAASIKAGFGFEINDQEQFNNVIYGCLHNPALRDVASSKARDYVVKNAGATKKMLQEII